MGVEIERKFLANERLWLEAKPVKGTLIRQSYLVNEPDKVIRVRTAGDKGYLTIKGKTTGVSRQEFEYEIPFDDANQLINGFTKKVIEKMRYFMLYASKTWFVDEFLGINEGLIVAEIELTSPEEEFDIPQWLGREVTLDFKYSNSNLVDNPYCQW